MCGGLDCNDAVFDNLDSDWDGVPNGCDQCPGFDDTQDGDADGVPDGCDICPGADDDSDSDADGVPNGCDQCPGFDDYSDSDGDGVADGCDVCPGGDDTIDTDGDGIPDACDQGGPAIQIAGSCPGTIQVAITGATPFGAIAIATSPSMGNLVVPVGPCTGTVTGLGGGGGLTLWPQIVANGAGNAIFTPNVPAGACGLYAQVLDISTCTPSNVGQIPN